MMKRLMPWITAASLVGLCAAVARSSPAPAPPFRAAVEAHLAAIAARDMDALLPTLTGGNDLTMIAPNGYKVDTRQQYVDFHRQWFATKDDGKLAAEIVRLIESPAPRALLDQVPLQLKGQRRKATGHQQLADFDLRSGRR
jgi:ketosteroid isomerase-like protein